MTPTPRRADPLSPWLLGLAAAVLAFRAWTSFCFFPFVDWNDVRLAPTFMLWHGPSPYPDLATGPITTWTYGPVPLLINLPALLGRDTAAALLIAAALNLLLAAVPVALAVFATPARTFGLTLADRGWALLLCLALWPNSSLHYTQSDNAAIALGLISCVLLLRAPAGSISLRLGAALCAALALWSKQSLVGLIAGQLLWLALTAGWRVALRYAAACIVFGAALGALFVAWFGFDGLWLNIFGLPAQFPYTADFAERTRDFWMALAGYVVLPLAGLLIARRHVFHRDSPWLLPALVWLFLLPTSVVALYKLGGASNSLNGVLYLLPLAALAAVSALRRLRPHLTSVWLATAALGVTVVQLHFAPLIPLQPQTAHLASGELLARRFSGHILFPWNPLLTFYAERRFYHVEDGLNVRRVSGAARPPAALARDLPPAWSVTAFPGWRDYGVFKQLQPAGAQAGTFGAWTVYTWAPPPPSPDPR